MKRNGVIFLVLMLFLATALYSGQDFDGSYTSSSIVTEPQVAKDFQPSADGDVSPASITSFTETLADDTLFYPDGDLNITTVLASEGDHELTSSDSYLDTQALDGSAYEVWSDASAPCNGYIWLNFSVPNDINLAPITVNIYCLYKGAVSEIDVHNISAYDGSIWVEIADIPADFSSPYTSYDWANATVPVSYVTDDKIMVRLWVQESFLVGINVDYAEIELSHPLKEGSEHYAESFADVSDWTEVSLEAGDTSSTDGDVLSLQVHYDSGTDDHYLQQNDISIAAGSYIEYRYFRNSSSAAQMRFLFYSDDGYSSYVGSAYLSYTTSSWETRKLYASYAIEAVKIQIQLTTGQGPILLKIDYLRISPADETGWQHDGSTTVGVREEALNGWAYSYSSNGDLLTLTFTRSGGTSTYGSLWIDFDTTATKADLERDYYPFFVMNWQSTVLTANNVYADLFVDGYRAATPANYFGGVKTSTFPAETDRLNSKAFTSTDSRIGLRIVCAGDSGESGTIKIDFVKAYSIANFTYTGSGVSSDDYAYVASSVLYCSGTSFTSIVLDRDPALSVATATYNVWNVTTGSGTPQTDYYVAAWAGYSSETRGELASGTLTDVRIKFTASANIAAIKFITDATAPTVVRSFTTPDPAQDDETVTLSAVIEDTVEVYTVDFNAIVYPVGFSDVDYGASEQSDNLWTYSFGSLDAGYYCFKIVASDGANENALTEYAYISLTVRSGTISINPITFFGVGDDFTQMQLSFDINRDCTYTIWEASATYSESDTHTGTVVEGWNNIAWDKISVTDTSANFSISFVNGSLSTWVNGSYSIAQTTFYVQYFDHNGPDAATNVTVTGRISKLASYTLYVDNVQNSLGTISTLDFRVTFAKTASEQAWHTWALKFVNGSQTCWANGTYYRWKYTPDKQELGDASAIDARGAYQVAIFCLFAIIAVGGYLAVQISELKGGNFK